MGMNVMRQTDKLDIKIAAEAMQCLRTKIRTYSFLNFDALCREKVKRWSWKLIVADCTRNWIRTLQLLGQMRLS
jgi:hypothetical protein